jgi:hypothetical protein
MLTLLGEVIAQISAYVSLVGFPQRDPDEDLGDLLRVDLRLALGSSS